MDGGSSTRPDGVPSDPFETLGLEPTFRIDPGVLRERYLAQMAVLHPDLAGGNDEAARAAARLNRARAVVADPEQRAWALLRRFGVGINDADRSLPDGFLMTMMEIREAIDAEGAQAFPKWRAWGDAQRAGHLERVGAAFDVMGTNATPDQVLAIRRELNAWRYIERLLEQIRPVDGRGGSDAKD